MPYVIPKRLPSRSKCNTCTKPCACWCATTAAESIPKPFKQRAVCTGVLAECVTGQRRWARDSVYGAGQAREPKCASPFRFTSRNGPPCAQSLGKKEQDIDERHPNFERRRSPIGPGGYRQHHQQPGRYVAGRSGL